MAEQIFVLLTLVGIFYSLLKNIFPPSVSFLSGLAILVIAGIIPVQEAFIGFSNQNLVIIGSLFVLARALQSTINIAAISKKMFGEPNSKRKSLLRIMVPVSASSAFVNNTPVVAMLINPIINWSREHNVSASRFLIPLSYAAIFGGALTLIGTSTNLVVSGLLSDYGYEPFSFFELTRIGLPLAIIGLTTIVILAPKLIPERKLADLDEAEIEKGFTIDVSPQKTILSKTVNDAGLRHLKDVFLAEIIRANGDVIAPVSPETQIKKGDTLRFSGNAESLAKLAKRQNLKPIEDKHITKLNNRRNVYIESVVGHNKSIAGRSLAEIGFRAKYQAAVLAIFRSGEKIKGSLGNVELKPGDSLLLVTDEGFEGRWQDRSDFLYLRQIGSDSRGSGLSNTNFYFVLLSMLLLAAFQVPLAIIVMFGALMTIILKINTTSQAKNAIDFELLIMIAAAIGVARAVDMSGLSGSASTLIIEYFGVFGVIGLLFGVVLATSILTELVTNNAAALLVFPIAVSTAVSAGADPRVFAMAIAIAASLSFVSPLGYQTNTMVYSAGGYKFSDFFRLGLVLNAITTISLVTITGVFFL